MVTVGAGNDVGARIYHQSDFMGATTVSSYRFSAPVVATSPELIRRGDRLITPPVPVL
jgi:hypothetical protein